MHEGTVAVADEQTAGRGRLGRGGRPPREGDPLLGAAKPPPQRRAPELSLVAGIAVADTVERTTGLAAQIKWPNDVMLRRSKVAGCLAEMRDGAVTLGIGINVNQTREELPPVTRLAAGLALRRHRPGVVARPSARECCSPTSSAATPSGSRAGSTRCIRTSARATSSAAGT